MQRLPESFTSTSHPMKQSNHNAVLESPQAAANFSRTPARAASIERQMEDIRANAL